MTMDAGALVALHLPLPPNGPRLMLARCFLDTIQLSQLPASVSNLCDRRRSEGFGHKCWEALSDHLLMDATSDVQQLHSLRSDCSMDIKM